MMGKAFKSIIVNVAFTFFLLKSGLAYSSEPFEWLKNLNTLTCEKCVDSAYWKRIERLLKKHSDSMRAAAKTHPRHSVELTDTQILNILIHFDRTHDDSENACVDAYEFQRIRRPVNDEFSKGDLLEWNLNENSGAGVGAEITTVETPVLEKTIDIPELPKLENAYRDCEFENFTEAGEATYQEILNRIKRIKLDGNSLSGIDLKCSSDTYRNLCGTGKEVYSAAELSKKRCDSLKTRLATDLNLSPDWIEADAFGENGDGSSGPLPFDTPNCSRDLNANEKERHKTREEYNQHKFAKVSVKVTPRENKTILVSKKFIEYYQMKFRCNSPSKNKSGLVQKKSIQAGDRYPCPGSSSNFGMGVTNSDKISNAVKAKATSDSTTRELLRLRKHNGTGGKAKFLTK